MTNSRILAFATVLLASVFIFGAFLALIPYLNPELPTPQGEFEWKSYRNDRLGYSIRIPVEYEIAEEEDGSATVFSYQGSSLVRLNWTTEEAARRRGLWPKHPPQGDFLLDGRQGKKYMYNHFDAIFGVRTVAYVVPYRGRLFGLEFRTSRVSIVEDVLGLASRVESQPEEFRERVVGSLRLDEF